MEDHKIINKKKKEKQKENERQQLSHTQDLS